MIRVLMLEDPCAEGYATRSGIHKYFYELVANSSASVQFVFLDQQIAGGASANIAGSKPPAEAGRPAVWTRFIPFWLRLSLGYWRDIHSLAKRLRPYRNQVDILHVVAGGCEISTIAAKLARFPRVLDTVSAMHGDCKYADHPVRRLIEYLCFRCADYHIFNADATRESWERRIGYKSLRNRTIFIGMQPPVYDGYDRQAYREKLCKDPCNTFLVGISARLAEMKGHAVLLEAIAALCAEQTADRMQPILLLLIAGEGPERDNIERKITELGIEANVRLLGHRDDPCWFTASLDLHVLPSLFIETMGYANIESMFAGVPCVVSDTGGMKEIVGVPGAGIVVPAGNAKALADAIRVYWHDFGRRHRDGERGRQFAHAELTAEVMVRRTQSIYKQLIGQQ